MDKNLQIDNLDRQILAILIEDARTPYTEIGKKLFVSGSTVHVRMNKMEEMGIIKRHQLIVNYKKLGFDVTAFLGIFLTKSSMYDKTMEQLKQVSEIVSLHYTTGSYSMFAEIVCRDTMHLREVLHDKIQAIEGISRTETLISLEESINRPLEMLGNNKL